MLKILNLLFLLKMYVLIEFTFCNELYIFLQKFNLVVKFFVVLEYRSVFLDSVVLLYFIFKVWVSDFQGPHK